MTIPPDFREFIELLNAHKVEYLLLGGYAVAAYGHVRATGDIDFWVNPTEENAKRVIVVLAEFGFQFPNLTAADFTNPDNIVQLGYPPFRIDLMTTTSDLKFSEAYARKKVIKLDGIDVSLIGLRDLRQNKRAAGRNKDLDDLMNLPEK